MTTGLTPMRIDDWTLFGAAGAWWIRDLDLAERAALAQPRNIRPIIRKAIEDGSLTIARGACDGRGGAGDGSGGGACTTDPLVRVEKVLVAIGSGASREVDEFYLNEEGALLIVTRLRTKTAIQLTRAVIRVFVMVGRGEIPVALPPARRPRAPRLSRPLAALKLLLEQAIRAGRLDVAAEHLAAARRLEQAAPAPPIPALAPAPRVDRERISQEIRTARFFTRVARNFLEALVRLADPVTWRVTGYSIWDLGCEAQVSRMSALRSAGALEAAGVVRVERTNGANERIESNAYVLHLDLLSRFRDRRRVRKGGETAARAHRRLGLRCAQRVEETKP